MTYVGYCKSIVNQIVLCNVKGNARVYSHAVSVYLKTEHIQCSI